MKRWTSVILILAAWGAAAAAPVSFALRGSVLGNGGTPSAGGTIHLQGTAGQPARGGAPARRALALTRRRGSYEPIPCRLRRASRSPAEIAEPVLSSRRA
jgi:hypothetical protein